MKLIDLTIQNFMPYRGRQHLVFPMENSRNVMLVFGDNMRGKTSLLNALRWCFYGEALNRDRRTIPLCEIANMDTRAEGDWSFSVYCTFEVEGKQYDLRRVARPRALVNTPRHDSHFDVELSLARDGQVIRGDEIEHEINQVMPHQISRFFLFDAELLAEYQDLLIEDSDQGKRIKAAVEEVLGVPALVNGREEIRSLLKKAQAVLAKENRHTEGIRAQAEQYAALQAELEALNDSVADLESRAEKRQQEIHEIETVLSKTEAAQRAQGEMDALVAQQKRLQNQDTALEEERRSLSALAWRDLLQPRLRAHLDKLTRERNAIQAQLEQRGALSAKIDQLRRIVASSECAVCLQPISAEHRDRFGAQLGRLEVEIGELSANLERVGALSSEISRLTKISGTGAAERLGRIERDLDRNAVDLVKIDSKIEELKATIRGFDSAEVQRLRTRRDALIADLGRIGGEIKKARSDIDERQNKQNQLSKMISKAPEARTQRSAREVQLYGELEKLFARGVDVLQERLRASVAENATAAFLKLTTEDTYTALRINENYGLTILDRDRRAVELRSAGAEQVVALSLIDGLNKTARKAGPIVIDTPLGRLDPRHREKVLSYLPTMAEQVVLLVHEGEIDRNTGITPFANRIGGVYEIARISSSHSELRRS
jgi:DNA sulfur modification protein DndD